MRTLCISITCIAIIAISGCRASKCPIAEYQSSNNNNPVNSWCGEHFKDDSKIYAAGDAVRPISGGQSITVRMAQSMAIQNLARKVSEFNNAVSYLVQEKTANDSKHGRMIKMRFDVQLEGVKTVAKECIEIGENFHCYSAVEMPRNAVVNSVKASLKSKLKGDSDKYRSIINSKEFRKQIAAL